MSDAPATNGPLHLAGRELRPPANALLGFAELLLASPLGPEQREYAETIRACGESILQLSGDLLDLARIEAGPERPAPAALPFDPAAVLREAAAFLERESAARKVKIFPRADPVLPPQVVGEAGRFRLLILAALRNVLHAVEGTRLEVALTCGTVPGNRPALRLEIRETHAPEEGGAIPAIHGGLPENLGLALARQLCRSSGGDLAAPGNVPPGTPFLTAWIAVETPAAAPSAPFRILVVEDNPVNQRLLLALLRRIGCHDGGDGGLVLAVNGEEALEKLRAQPFDLVFMDVQMPVMDGFECTRRIRMGGGGSRHTTVQIVAVTAGAMRGDRERCLTSGMDEYLSKPISSANLEAVLAKMRGKPAAA